MTRIRLTLLALTLTTATATLGACEDPIIVVGDLPGIMRRVAGVPGRLGDEVDPASARSTLLAAPTGIAVADDGTVYIADGGNGRVVEVTRDGGVTIVAGPDTCDGAACPVEPNGLALAPDGSLWIADPGANRIFRLDRTTRLLEVRAGSGADGTAPDGTPALEAALDGPTGIAITSGGTVYFSERRAHRVRWIQGQGVIRTIAGTGEAGYADGSPATEALLHSPAGLALAGTLLYVADEENHRVRVINLNGGTIDDVAGNGIPAYSGTDSIARTATLSQPTALAVTADRTQLYIADTGNDRVRVVNLATGRIGTFAGSGVNELSAEGDDAADTSLEGPAGLAIHPQGVLFIADTGHQIVWRTPVRF